MTDVDLAGTTLALLTALGSTADEVADSLRTLGHRGHCGGATCPLAVYLATRLGLPVWVDAVDAVVYPADTDVYDVYGIVPAATVRLPVSCATFVDAFDGNNPPRSVGAYPDLRPGAGA